MIKSFKPFSILFKHLLLLFDFFKLPITYKGVILCRYQSSWDFVNWYLHCSSLLWILVLFLSSHQIGLELACVIQFSISVLQDSTPLSAIRVWTNVKTDTKSHAYGKCLKISILYLFQIVAFLKRIENKFSWSDMHVTKAMVLI